ncbi:MAG: hypothetical protein HQM11_10015 [SAR324 cluster bacterium]|nr:hypothetical protein [SAR324 cluster bacterium]
MEHTGNLLDDLDTIVQMHEAREAAGSKPLRKMRQALILFVVTLVFAGGFSFNTFANSLSHGLEQMEKVLDHWVVYKQELEQKIEKYSKRS